MGLLQRQQGRVAALNNYVAHLEEVEETLGAKKLPAGTPLAQVLTVCLNEDFNTTNVEVSPKFGPTHNLPIACWQSSCLKALACSINDAKPSLFELHLTCVLQMVAAFECPDRKQLPKTLQSITFGQPRSVSILLAEISGSMMLKKWGTAG